MNRIYKLDLYISCLIHKGTVRTNIDTFEKEVVFKCNPRIEVNKISDLRKRVSEVNASVVKDLIDVYKSPKNYTVNFSQFVRGFSEYIFTKEILKELYVESGNKSDFSKWLSTFRKSNDIDLYTISDVIEYIEIYE